MKRLAKTAAVLAVVLIAGIVSWQRWGTQARTWLFMTAARASWQRVRTCEARVAVKLAESGLTLSGDMSFRKPSLLRLECGQPHVLSLLFVVSEDRAWVLVEALLFEKLAAEVKLPPATRQELGARGSVVGWLEEVLATSDIELLPQAQLQGRDCRVVRLTPRPAEGMAAAHGQDSPGLVPQAVEFVEAMLRVADVTLYVDKDHMLPIRAELNNAAGNRLATISLTDVRINEKVADDTFRFEVPRDAKLVTLDFTR